MSHPHAPTAASLKGKRILITRAKEQAAALSDELRRFLGNADPEDDISIAAIRRKIPAS